MGCGAGRTTFALQKLGYKNISGIDICPPFIEYANKKAIAESVDISFSIGDATNLELEDNTFDVVLYSYNGLMCIPTSSARDMAVYEISRILKPQGLFIFTTHDRETKKPEFAKFWAEEQKRWENGTQDKRLYDFGDRIIEDSGNDDTVFVHIPNKIEVFDLLKKHNLELIYSEERDNIAVESKEVKEFSNNCVFYVARKV